MNHITKTFLSQIPYPLYKSYQKATALEDEEAAPRIPSSSSQRPQISGIQQRYISAFESIVDLGEICQENNNAHQLFVQDNKLHHLYGNYYHTASQPTPLLKAAALHHALKSYQLPLIRFSRITAAWIWGFYPHKPAIHLDFDRANRINSKQAQLKKIVVHQIHLNPYDAVSFGQVQVTTPLHTLLDLLQFEDAQTTQEVVRIAVNDPLQGISLKLLQEKVSQQRFLQNRNRAQLLLERMNL